MVCLQELGILDNPNYKICFLLDSGAMITVLSSKYGLIEVDLKFFILQWFNITLFYHMYAKTYIVVLLVT